MFRKRLVAFGAVLLSALATAVTVNSPPAAAAEPISCQYWSPFADNGLDLKAEVGWPTENGSHGTVRARPNGPRAPGDNLYEVCKWGGYETIMNVANRLYLSVEKDWTGIYKDTVRARTPKSQLGTWERFHITCYPNHPQNAYPHHGFCIVWAEANHKYLAAEFDPSIPQSSTYYGVIRARTDGPNIGAWEYFYHTSGDGPAV